MKVGLISVTGEFQATIGLQPQETQPLNRQLIGHRFGTFTFDLLALGIALVEDEAAEAKEKLGAVLIIHTSTRVA